VCLLAQQAPPTPAPPSRASYRDAARSIRSQSATCANCKRGATMIQLVKYEYLADLLIDGAGKPAVDIERFTWRCHICAETWRKNVIVK
jgi:hypothetical protein